MRRGVQAAPLRAPQPRAREKTHGPGKKRADVKQQKTLVHSNTRLPFGEWGVPRGLTQAGTPQEKIPIALQLSVGVSYLATKKKWRDDAK